MAKSEAEVKKEIEKSKGKIGIGHIAMILVTGLAAALIISIIYIFVSGKGWDGFAVAYAISFAAFLPVNYLLFSYKYKCKKCGTKWSREEAHTENIDSYTKTKQEKYRDGKFERVRDVQYRVTEYWQYFICKHCSDVTREKEKSEKRI